jgi:hypothetical protein
MSRSFRVVWVTALFVAWLAGISSANAQGAANADDYVVSIVGLKAGWYAVRMEVKTGKSWFVSSNDWKPCVEVAPAPPGEYRLVCQPLGDADWIAVRYNAKTGQSWRLAGTNWIEMKDSP